MNSNVSSKKLKRLMIDIETLSTLPTAKIVEIGVCEVPENPEATIEFMNGLVKNNTPIAPSGYDSWTEKSLFHEDPATVRWWQSYATRFKHLCWLDENGIFLPPALSHLTAFIHNFKPDEVWCKGASFDFAILRYAYATLGQPLPWSYRQERCMRVLSGQLTEQELAIKDEYRASVIKALSIQAHCALDDAILQAYELSWMIDTLDTLTSN